MRWNRCVSFGENTAYQITFKNLLSAALLSFTLLWNNSLTRRKGLQGQLPVDPTKINSALAFLKLAPAPI